MATEFDTTISDLQLDELVGKFGKRRENKNKAISSFKCDSIIVTDKKELKNLPSEINVKGGKAWVTVTGNDMPAIHGVNIKYYGKWIKNSYGWQFKAKAFEVLIPKTEKGIQDYIASFDGVSMKDAQLLVKEFGKDVLSVIEYTPEKIYNLLGATKAMLIINTYEKTKSVADLFKILCKYGISQDKIMELYETYGAEVYEIIRINPYRFMEYGLLSFSQCDTIAIGEGIALDSYERVSGFLQSDIKEFERTTGSTAFVRKKLLDKGFKDMNENKEVIKSDDFFKKYNKVLETRDGLVEKEFTKKKEDGSIVRTHIIQSSLAYYAEEEISIKLQYIASGKVGIYHKMMIRKEAEKYFAESPVKLSKNQQTAVVNSLLNHLSIITGGPGTGKTTILKAIINIYDRVFGNEITLMAPTGKAARRMQEATGFEARTIHSRIGIYGEKAEVTERICEGLIVVDESSMIDLYTMQKLMKAIDSNNVHLLFCGDIDQLPSVGCGTILDSMIESNEIYVSRLTETFRQKNGGTIIGNAIAINEGKPENVEFNDSDFVFVEAKSELEASEKILELFKEESQRVGIDNVALLTPLRRTMDGKYLVCSDGLNPKIQDAINPVVEGQVYKTNRNGLEFRVNDRVLQWENTDTSSNGDIGIIQNIREKSDGSPEFEILWDNGNLVTLSRKDMESITLGYSISVHKSQGSEYKTVIIPMLSSQERSPLLRRNLIYTGITRAKEKVIIVGSKKTFNTCVLTVESREGKRLSYLADRIRYIFEKRKAII